MDAETERYRVAAHLPQDMRWDDEFEWNKVGAGHPQRTLSGGLVTNKASRQRSPDYAVWRLGMA